MERPTGDALHAELAVKLFGWKRVDYGFGWQPPNDPSTEVHPYWTCEQIAAKLRERFPRALTVWGWDELGAAIAVCGAETESVPIPSSIPTMEQPRHALGWLALRLLGER